VEAWIEGLPDRWKPLARVAPEAAVKMMEKEQEGPGVPSYGVQPHYERDAEGNIYAVQYGSDGTRKATKLENAPFAVESKTPEFQRDVAEQRATGAETGKQRAEAQMNYPALVDKANQGLQVVEDLLKHPGMSPAVGVSSMFPSMPGGDAANYEARLRQLEGKMFLDAFESLRGGGQISEIEGVKATQAISDISVKQSLDAHKKSLETLRDIFSAAKRRAAIKAGYKDESESTSFTTGGGFPPNITIKRIGD
jgi:hypothetical protein